MQYLHSRLWRYSMIHDRGNYASTHAMLNTYKYKMIPWYIHPLRLCMQSGSSKEMKIFAYNQCYQMLTTHNLASPKHNLSSTIRYDLVQVYQQHNLSQTFRQGGEISHLKCSCCTGPNNLKMETVTSDAACDKHRG